VNDIYGEAICIGYYMFLRQQVIWCLNVSEDNTNSQVKLCNNLLTVYLDPQTIDNPKVWNNKKNHLSMVASSFSPMD